MLLDVSILCQEANEAVELPAYRLVQTLGPSLP